MIKPFFGLFSKQHVNLWNHVCKPATNLASQYILQTMTILQAQLVQLAERLTTCWRSRVWLLVLSMAFWWHIICPMQCPLHSSYPLVRLQHGTDSPQRAYWCQASIQTWHAGLDGMHIWQTKSKHSSNQYQTFESNHTNQCQTFFLSKSTNQCQTWSKPKTNLVLLLGKFWARQNFNATERLSKLKSIQITDNITAS